MKKKDWGNAVWFLFHTLAEKIKPEFATPAELRILVDHIISICDNLPCPFCQNHAMTYLRTVNKNTISESKEKLIDFLWNFHNNVNRITKAKYYTKEELDKYKTANTGTIVSHFMKVMAATSNNEKTMLHGFHRSLFLKKFRQYIQVNHQKFNA